MLRLAWDQDTAEADLVLTDNQLEADDGLETAVTISLFTDARADPDIEHPGPKNDPRGWWAEQYLDVPGDVFGSRLWTLQRAKPLESTLRQAETYAKEALAWMVRDGVASVVEVVAERVRDNILGLAVSIYRPGESAPWANTWELYVNGL